MSAFGSVAACGEITAEIFENYAEVNVSYSLDCSGSGEVLLPFVPDGMLCGLTVLCGGEVFSSARAVNIRELNAALHKKCVTVSRRTGGLIVLGLDGVPDGKKLDVKIKVIVTLRGHENHLSLVFPGGGAAEETAKADVCLKIYGEVSKVISPTHKITVSVSKECTVAQTYADASSGSLVFDIFYKKNRAGGVMISRRLSGDNIALCYFVPELEGLEEKPVSFDINILTNQEKIGHGLIHILSVLLECMDEAQSFCVSINGEYLTDYISCSEENINSVIDLICSYEGGACGKEITGTGKKIIICDGNASLPGEVSQADMVIAGGINNGLLMKNKNCFCVSEATAEIVIPREFGKAFGVSLSPGFLEPIGGIGVKLVKVEKEIVRGETVHCFARHSVIPPKGIKILDKKRNEIEQAELKAVLSRLDFLPVEIMYAMECVKILENEMKTAAPENRCLIREEINELCLQNRIALGDIALASFSGENPVGIITQRKPQKPDFGTSFREDMSGFSGEIVDYILFAQTADGVIGDISVGDKNMLVFSTAVCLIALYLYTGDKYKAFAKRSIDFLSGKDGYWAETALSLWNGEKVDLVGLTEKADMKIMYERIDELAILSIKNYRRKIK